MLTVGDEVIYLARSGAMPVKDTVRRVTASGWINLAGVEGVAFRPSRGSSRWSHGDATVYPFSEQTWQEALGQHRSRKKVEKEKRAQQEAWNAERDARIAEELRQVKELLGNDYLTACRFKETLADGSRFLVFSLPVPEDLRARNGTQQVVVVRIATEEERPWRKDAGMSASMVRQYAAGPSRLFASSSGSGYSTDDEAIWDCLRSAYSSGW